MIYSNVFGTDLSVSKAVLGTDAFGTTLSAEESFSMMDAYIDRGGNALDTASVYADWLGSEKSASEKTIGKWLFERKCREKIIVSTKGGHPDCNNMRIPRLSAEEIKTDLENSLINLKTDYIDIYWLHRDDENRPVEEIIECLNRHVAAGKIRFLGASNWKYDRIKAANDYASKNGLTGFAASQIQYNIGKLNDRSLVNEMLGMSFGDTEYEKYKRDHLSMFSYSSLAKGFFALVAENNLSQIPEQTKREYLNDHNLKLAEKLKIFAAERGTTVAPLMIKLLVSNKDINTFAQIGTKKVSRLCEALDFDDIDICGFDNV